MDKTVAENFSKFILGSSRNVAKLILYFTIWAKLYVLE